MKNLIAELRRRLNVTKRQKSGAIDVSEPSSATSLVQNQDFDLAKIPPCPKCKSAEVAKIVYGKPALTRQVIEGLESGKIISGGCMIQQGAPEWHCNRCNKDFGRLHNR